VCRPLYTPLAASVRLAFGNKSSDTRKELRAGTAANYDLQRYLMTDFHSLRFDFGAYYEFWFGGGSYTLDDSRCLVMNVERV